MGGRMGRRPARRLAVSLVACTSLLLGACGGGGTDNKAESGGPNSLSQSEWDDVVASAEQEGELVVYASLIGAEEVFAKFQEAYPNIKITVERTPTGDLISRLDQEIGVNAPGADIAFHAQEEWFNTHSDAGDLAAIKVSPEASELGWEERIDDKEFTGFYSFPYLIGYNTDLAEPVESIEDIVEKAGNSPIGVTSPAAATAIAFQYETWSGVYGDDLIERLGKLNVSAEMSSATLSQNLASGEFHYVICLSAGALTPLIESGAPVAEVVPPEGQTGPLYNGAALANAAHPNAAQVFMNWLMSEPAQQLMTDSLAPASVPLDIKGAIPWGDIKHADVAEWDKATWDGWIADEWQPYFN